MLNNPLRDYDRDMTTDNENYGSYSVDDEDQLQPEDTLVDRGVDDALDEGYTAPEQWSAGQGYGNTAEEELRGETLDQRLKQEVPDVDEVTDDLIDKDLDETEVGQDRSGRLVAPDEGLAPDAESEALAADVGIDGAAATAEEAAMHVVEDQ